MTAPLTAPVTVKFGATGVTEVQRGLKLVGSEGQAAAQKVGGSMRQIAGGVEAIARQGKVGGEALKGIIAQGAEMAFMFGAGGPIVGALAITGLAIYEHITSNVKAARDEINKFRDDLEKMDLMTAAKAQQFRFSGDPRALRKEGESNADFIARRFGIEGTRNRIEELRGQIPKNILDQIGRGATFFSGNTAAVTAASEEMVELLKNLGKLKRELTELTPITAQLAEEEGKRAKNAAMIAGEGRMSPEEFAARVAAATARFAAEAAAAPKMPGVQYMGTTPTVPLIGGAEGHRAFGLKAANIGDGFRTDFVNPLADSITKSIASGIGDAISAGFDEAFAKGGNLGGVLGAFGGVALRTIGGVFKDIGMQTLLGMKFMAAIRVAIMSWNPALGIAASIGLIALGSALQAAGSRAMGGGGSGGGGGGGGGGYSSGSGGPTIIDRGIINPVSASNITPMRSVVNNFTVIGASDPVAQRQIAEMVDMGNNRRLGRT